MSLRAAEWSPLLNTVSAVSPESEAQKESRARLESPDTVSREAWRYTTLRSLRGCSLHNAPIASAITLAQGARAYTLKELKTLASQDDLARRALGWIEETQAQKLALLDAHRLHHSPDRDAQVILVSAGQSAGISAHYTRTPLSAESQRDSSSVSGSISAPALWIYLDEDARLTLDERYRSDTMGVTLGLTGVYVSAGSHLTHLRAQLESRGASITQEGSDHIGATHLSHLCAQIDGRGTYQLTHLNLGARESRVELDISLNEPEAHAELSGLYVGTQEASLDQHLTVRHRAPRCVSAQRFRGVLGDKSRGTFTGRVVVAEGASQTRADQHNPNLLLSENARAVTRPQLEIYNDDVECSHGATVGQLDADALFYLRARGLTEAIALQALTAAFVGEVRAQVNAPELLSEIDHALLSALGVQDSSRASELWIDWEQLKVIEEGP